MFRKYTASVRIAKNATQQFRCIFVIKLNYSNLPQYFQGRKEEKPYGIWVHFWGIVQIYPNFSIVCYLILIGLQNGEEKLELYGLNKR